MGPPPDAAARNRLATLCASALNRMEKGRLVRRAGRPRHLLWSITAAGTDRLADGDPRKKPRGFTHGAQYGYNQAGCRCEACRAWAAASHQKFMADHPEKLAEATERLKQMKLADPEKDREVQARHKARARSLNAELAAAAIERGRHWQRWTGPDLEMASRRDLTAAQIAAMIGRSERSVTCMRERLADANPRDRMLADGPTPPTSRSGPR